MHSLRGFQLTAFRTLEISHSNSVYDQPPDYELRLSMDTFNEEKNVYQYLFKPIIITIFNINYNQLKIDK